MATVDGEDDVDGDGWGSLEDCDDARADIHPGAAEVAYDGIDQDCDGADLLDRDADGYDGIPGGGEDCDDGDGGVHPDAGEICGDLIDQDCDGVVDGGCASTGLDATPGGFAWVCGLVPGPPGPMVAWLAVLWVGWRLRRWA